MQNKIIGFLVCILLISATLSSVTGGEIVNKNEGSHCGLANTLGDPDKENMASQSNDIGVLNGRDTPFYAYCAWDPSGTLVEGPVYFDPATPGTITQLAPTTSIDFIAGGTWTKDGKWYGCEWGEFGNSNIWTINSTTGDMTLVGSYDPLGIGLSFNGLAYNPRSGIMYGCSDTTLYTVNMSTGASIPVGFFGIIDGSMIGIAIDDIGNIYGEELSTDSLYHINSVTGRTTLIGELGIDIEFAQDMAYDNDTKTLYLSAFTSKEEGSLYTCNTSTGESKKVGDFQHKAQITGFAIPYGNGGQQDTTPPTTTHQFTPEAPSGENGWYVNDVTVTFTASDDTSGVAWTNYSLDNGATWATHTGPASFDVIVGECEHKLLYYSVDNAGNEEPIKGPFALKIDKTIPEKKFWSFTAVFGFLAVAIINFGIVRDGCSGLEKVQFYLNGNFSHQTDLSGWPVGNWRIIFWIYYNPGVGDKCTGIVYDMAGNSEQIKPEILPVPQSYNRNQNKNR